MKDNDKKEKSLNKTNNTGSNKSTSVKKNNTNKNKKYPYKKNKGKSNSNNQKNSNKKTSNSNKSLKKDDTKIEKATKVEEEVKDTEAEIKEVTESKEIEPTVQENTNTNTNTNTDLQPAKKKSKKKVILMILSIIMFLIGITLVIFFTQFGLLKEVYIEAGSEKTINLKDFYKKGIVVYKSSIVSEIEELNLREVKDYDIKIKVFNKVKTIKLKVVDTTPPKVKFKDFTSNINYEINPDDFIETKEDVSEMETKVINPPTIDDYNDYKVTISVKDKYGNETKATKNLRISLFKEEFNLEYGNKLKKEDILFDLEKGQDYINQEDIDKINNSNVGDYEIKVTVNDIEFTSKIIVRDTKAPDLVLKNITIYDDQQLPSKDSFIKSVKDASKYTVELKTSMTKKLGNQELTFEAVDEHNNKVTKKATLSIIKDTVGPSINGLYNMSVNKYSKPNYYSGVSAYDAKDGKVSFTVNSSKVNTSKYGTYYVTYTAVDKAGNKTTKSRKITVNHDASDTSAKVSAALSKSGTNYESIRQWIMKNVRYSSGNSSDPVWYGLTNYSGNCIVHAYLYQAMLNKAGYQTKIIYTTDKTHYWVMIYLNGKWWHTDATPTSRHKMISKANDEERFKHLQGRNWDRNKWPKAG